jgi:hypothetical protein
MMPSDLECHSCYPGVPERDWRTQEEMTCESCTLAALAEAAPPC